MCLVFRELHTVTCVILPHTVELCLRALRQLVPPVLAVELLTHYYVTCHHLHSIRLVQQFHSLLLSCLGMGEATGESSWKQIQGRFELEEDMIAALPALQLLNIATTKKVVGSHGNEDATPTCTTPFLKDHAETVLLALHLVYEVSCALCALISPPPPPVAILLNGHYTFCVHKSLAYAS